MIKSDEVSAPTGMLTMGDFLIHPWNGLALIMCVMMSVWRWSASHEKAAQRQQARNRLGDALQLPIGSPR
jgi:hypothetical protein